MKRLPRKIKKELKKKFKNRYGYKWLKGYSKERLLIEYIWFFKNPFNWNMNLKLRSYEIKNYIKENYE